MNSRSYLYLEPQFLLREELREPRNYFSVLEGGRTDPVARFVAENLTSFIGIVFEDLCRDWVMEQGAMGRLPFVPERIGAWWARDEEIDVVAVGGDTALFGECKWTARRVGVNILDDLKRKAYPVVQEGGWERVRYALFSRSGFTAALGRRARDEGILLVGPEDLLSVSSPPHQYST